MTPTKARANKTHHQFGYTKAREGIRWTAVSVSAMIALATPAMASPAHRMLLLANMHTCDFQLVTSPEGHPGAKPLAEISSDGHVAVARVDMTSGARNVQYLVRMIPAPHPPLGCLPGDPSIVTGALQTDDSGTGTATIRMAVAPGVTGMWLAVDLPSVHSQTPQEFYSSNYIASV